MTTIRLVWGSSDSRMRRSLCADASLQARRHITGHSTGEEIPALLCSFYYLKSFRRYRDDIVFRDWSMDSGAYSAFKSGAVIDLQEYTETCLELLETDPKLVEVFTLDVIGDHRATLRNTERLWENGVPAIPIFHFSEPWEHLQLLVKLFPFKIGIGGAAKVVGKRKVLQAREIISRVWPMRIHGLGFGAENALMELPFHSVDTSSWFLQPCSFGLWKSFGGDCAKGRGMSVRGQDADITAQVVYYLKMEQKLKKRWKLDMDDIEREAPAWPMKKPEEVKSWLQESSSGRRSKASTTGPARRRKKRSSTSKQTTDTSSRLKRRKKSTTQTGK